jgi:hypothetical protein
MTVSGYVVNGEVGPEPLEERGVVHEGRISRSINRRRARSGLAPLIRARSTPMKPGAALWGSPLQLE